MFIYLNKGMSMSEYVYVIYLINGVQQTSFRAYSNQVQKQTN